ncbi:unnamed protein product [Clonostachys solani]|uniref:DNA replication licensing factor mcm10 n=1 Tax=Clonostachys solani TaxID=160281 RepID=A0A9P0EIE7_9HYPO|nr:unnamed protein product [Clonostachys solani]
MPPGRAPEAQWPPRSPRDALLSTPSGRSRYQKMLSETSPSSPSRKLQRAVSPSPGDAMDLDDDDDEETLQLKLQELQAKLKLKRLQNVKARASGLAATQQRTQELRSGFLGEHRQSPTGTMVFGGSIQPTPQDEVLVPVSPIRRRQEPPAQTSPRRVQLGIDKGLKARDVSLKRAPVFKRQKIGNETGQSDGYLRTSRSSYVSDGSISIPARPLSFSERLAGARSQEVQDAERRQQVQTSRSESFGIGREEMEKYKSSAIDIPDVPMKAPSFSRDEVMSKRWSTSGSLKRSNTTTGVISETRKERRLADSKDMSSNNSESEPASFEAFSGYHLSRRILPHTVLARHISGKKVMSVKDLLRSVKAPDFSLPDVEQDIVVFGIVAKKSEPRAHKAAPAKNGLKPEDRGSYMVLNIVDLDYEVDLFLFNSGFARFWKITEGTVVSILNPNIMPPPPGRQDTGRFSLVINSDQDTILEIGISRDLGYCQTVKKDGKPCGAWVNKKRTHFCEFHTNEAVQKSKTSRIEMSTGSGFGSGEKKKFARYAPNASQTKQAPANYDWETKTRWFISRSMSSSDLIDGKDQAIDRKEKEAQLQRSLAAKERERDMMKKLGRIGGGAGKEYMQLSAKRTPGARVSPASSAYMRTAPSASEQTQSALESLGLQNKDREIHLSPIKRKRPISSQAGSVGSSSSSLGWGAGLKEKLARMKEGEKLRNKAEGQNLVEKQTRFVTEKGIRLAGRESIGNLSERQITLDDDDDDELIIVK